MLCFLQHFAEHIEKPSVFLCFLNSDCKKQYKTCVFCNILMKILKNQRFSFVFASRVLENLIKPVHFAIFCWTCWKTVCFPLCLELRMRKTLKNLVFFGTFFGTLEWEGGLPPRFRAGRPLWPLHAYVSFRFPLWCSMRTLRSKLLLGKNIKCKTSSNSKKPSKNIIQRKYHR